MDKILLLVGKYTNSVLGSSQTVKFNIGNFNFTTPYVQIFGVILLVFLFILLMAFVRRHYLNWSLKGFWFGLFLGFAGAIIIEGFLIINGKTFLLSALGWKTSLPVVSSTLDLGRQKLINVLGVSAELEVKRQEKSVNDIVKNFQSLTPVEARRTRSLICAP